MQYVGTNSKSDAVFSMRMRLLFILIIVFPLMWYVWIRAQHLSFTHDESLSFTITEGSDWKHTANNHLLNTALMTYTKNLFGRSEVSLRLPNVLSFILYLISCVGILNHTKNKWVFALGACLFFCNPFLLEFFSLARGYGLSMGFMSAGMYFLFRRDFAYTSASGLLQDFFFSLLFASLAVYANLIMINFFIGVVILFALKYVLTRRGLAGRVKSDFCFAFLLLLAAIPLLLGSSRLLFLRATGGLYVGEDTLSKSLESIITSSVYVEQLGPSAISVIKALVLLTIILSALRSVQLKTRNGRMQLSLGLICIICIISIMQSMLFEAKFPTERTALFYVPLFATLVFFLSSDLIESATHRREYYGPLTLCLILPLLINFYAGLNLTYTTTWHYDAHTKDAMRLVRRYIRDQRTRHRENSGRVYSISNDWLFEPTINHYRYIWGVKLAPADRGGIHFDTDFVYARGPLELPSSYRILGTFDDTESKLYVKSN